MPDSALAPNVFFSEKIMANPVSLSSIRESSCRCNHSLRSLGIFPLGIIFVSIFISIFIFTEWNIVPLRWSKPALLPVARSVLFTRGTSTFPPRHFPRIVLRVISRRDQEGFHKDVLYGSCDRL